MFLASALMVLGAVGVVVWGVMSPVSIAEEVGVDGGSQPVASGDGASEEVGVAGPGVEALLAVGSFDWQRPLFDVAGPAAATAVEVSPVSLIGTIEESGFTLAVLRTADGRTEIRGVGESFEAGGGAVRVRSIEGRVVMVEAGGRVFSLSLPDREGGGVDG